MANNKVFTLMSIAVVSGSIWYATVDQKRTTDFLVSPKELDVQQEDKTITSTSLVTVPLENMPKQTDNDNKISLTQTAPKQASTQEEAHTKTPERSIFQGNSRYTGDDTEDNDAGNAGFEDDFPDANNLPHGSDFAEAYSEYSETHKASN